MFFGPEIIVFCRGFNKKMAISKFLKVFEGFYLGGTKVKVQT